MPRIALDVECLVNYFMVGFLNHETGNIIQFEKYDGCEFDARRVMAIMRKRQTYGFNSANYDLPMIFLACAGLSCADLKGASDLIILGDKKPWHLEKIFDVRFPKVDHIDIIEVAPGQASLKIYGGRVHSKKMQDMPIEHDARITAAQRPVMRLYNGNDLWTTDDLRKPLEPQLALREQMTEEFGIDLRSKSDAQMAEAVIRSKIQQLTGTKPERPLFDPSTKFRYRAPDFIQFKTPALRQILAEVERAEFTLANNGKPQAPDTLEGRVVKIGKSSYKMGMGGLHSSEKSRAHLADDEFVLIDRDVKSYYPLIVLVCELFPKHLGKVFLRVFASFVRRRLAAKAAGDDVIADCFKILINGTFGKLGSIWSCLYSPDLLIQVTLTGQLALLMLIESIELAGIRVVSANTDGVVIKTPRAREDDVLELVQTWEKNTGFETEETRYSAVFSRDVNNYIAVYETPKEKKGKKIFTKTKGVYADPGLQKNPTNQICVAAVIEHLIDGADIEETVRGCADIRQFVSIRKVDGGATKDGEVLGKAIRWYYSTSTKSAIHYKRNGNLVPTTDGAMPLMELPEAFPDDVDYDWYVREAREMLLDIGVGKRIPVLGPLVQKRIDALIW